jgi:hypothetical protein
MKIVNVCDLLLIRQPASGEKYIPSAFDEAIISSFTDGHESHRSTSYRILG